MGEKLSLAAQCQLIAHTQAVPGGGPHPEEQVPLLYASIGALLFGNFALQDLSGPATLLGLGEEGGKILALSSGDHCGDDILAQIQSTVLDAGDYKGSRSNTKQKLIIQDYKFNS